MEILNNCDMARYSPITNVKMKQDYKLAIDIIEKIAETKVERKYDLTKPQGVRGRNSDNTLMKETTGWEPSIGLQEGLEKTYAWIYNEIKEGKQDASLNYSKEAGV